MVSTERGFTVWITGLPGSGKTTLGGALVAQLRARGRRAELLDGDALRLTLSKGLGFSKVDRDEHIRRIGFLAELLARHGVVVVVAAISPYRATRDEMRKRLVDFVEVYARCSLEELERRDPKGLYARARSGEIANFTGISDPYEEPFTPDLTVDTDRQSLEVSVAVVLKELVALSYLQ
jgi:adenylylsulfate kinase